MSRPTREELARWPKVELHCHLEGTVQLETAWRWARQSPTLAISSLDELRSRIQFDGISDFAHFLSKFQTLRELYYDRRAIEQVTREAVAWFAAQNVRYLELRFSPDHFSRSAGFDPAEIAELILRAGQDEAARLGVTLRFLCTIARNYDEPTARRILEIALANRDLGIVGLDLAGDEIRFPATRFLPLFEEAAAAGLGLTIHAGEAGPPASVWEAIDEIGADRIGHGIRSVEEPALLEALRERSVLLEVSPTSNYHTGVVAAGATHPLAALAAAGVPLAISTDDPAISRIDLTHEYGVAVDAGIEPGRLATMVVGAIDHAFLPEAEKEGLKMALTEELKQLTNLPFAPS